jgi:hypothetical protein
MTARSCSKPSGLSGPSLLLLLVLLLCATSSRASKEADEEFSSAGGYDTLRIEQEDKISVPPDKAAEVWEYMEATYIRDQSALKRWGSGFSSYASIEDFVDVYYDTPSLQILARRGGVRHRSRANITNPLDRKNNRQLMQVKINDISTNTLNRGELKYPIRQSVVDGTAPDGLPMLQMVKRSQRGLLRAQIVSQGLDPDTIHPILAVYDRRKRLYIQCDGKPFVSVSLDHAFSRRFWAKASFCEIEPEINEIPYTEGDAATRAFLEKVNTEIIEDLRRRFPYLERNLTPKYCKAFYGLEKKVPFLRAWIRLDAMARNGGITLALVSFTALAALCLFLIRRIRERRALQRAV